MGIRFYCPNGHKLNVKEHLAGKAGFCPECGARLVIPLQSTRKSSKELAAELVEGTEVRVQPAALPADSPLPPLELPVPNPVPSAAESVNPLLQDQSVVWYVQVLGGEQYGPLTGLVVHSWIQEQRISPAMLVWREGWENWLEAKNVFTELESK
jgi:hypothetical protein